MSPEPIRVLESRYVSLPWDNIDTDQIIPARFLQATGPSEITDGLFADWRRERPDFPLDEPAADGAAILVAGENFGCGSSREHAAWALAGAGFRAVVSPRIADIFRANAVKSGIVPVEVEPALARRLLDRPGGTLRIDVETCSLSTPEGEAASFDLEPFARHCLLEGIDELDFLLGADAEIAAFEASRGAAGGTA